MRYCKKRFSQNLMLGIFIIPVKEPHNPIEDTTYEKELMKPFITRKNSENYPKDVYIDEDGVYCYIVPHCSKCNSHHVTRHDL